MRRDIEEFMRVCDRLIKHYLTDEEYEEIVLIEFVVRKKTVRPYDELDDLAASIAFSELSSID